MAKYNKKITDLTTKETFALCAELASIQSEHMVDVFKLAKKFGVNEIELMKMVAYSIESAATDPEFIDNVSNDVWELVKD
jgi:hypothetical protein